MSTESVAGRAATPSAAADLGRRVRSRRHALELTINEVATRARMDPGFVEMIEERPAVLTVGALIRLADALNMTTSELLGAPSRRTPGSGSAAPHAVLEPIGPTECLHLLTSGGVGRVAAMAGGRLVVLPVNYEVHDGTVIFRTSPSSVLARLADGRVSFEIDRIDDGMRAGWSVLVSGPARVLTEPELHVLRAGVRVEPWAGGKRDLYVAVTPEEISGRRIHA